MRGVGVAGNLADDTHEFVGSSDMVGNGVRNLLRPFRGIGQVVLPLVFVYPRTLSEVGNVNPVYLTVNLNHVVLQFRIVTLAVAPNNIGLCLYGSPSIGGGWGEAIDEDGRVDAGPAVLRGEAVLVCQQWFPKGILIGTRYLV